MKHEPEVITLLRRFVNLVGPVWVARAAAVIGIMFVASLIMAMLHPAGGEALLYNICICSGILSAGLVGMLAAVGVGAGVNIGMVLISAGINNAKYMNAQKELPSGVPQYDIYPDDIVVEVPYGNRAAFEAEVAQKHAAQRKGTYLFVLEFRRAVMRVSDGTPAGKVLQRNDPDFCGWETHNFLEETPEQYLQYIDRALPALVAHLQDERLKETKGNVVSELYTKTAAVVIALLLCSVSVFAQSNSDKIREAVAGNDFAPKSGQQVHYVFSDGSSATRTADGTAKISDLFSARFGADNLQRGEVVGIDVDRVPLDIKIKIASSGTAQKPAPLFKTNMDAPHNEAVPPGKSFAESIPDSATVANTLNEAKQQLPLYKQVIFKMLKPVWEFAAWLFFFLCPLFGIALGFCNLVSRSARQNGNLGPAVADQQIRFAAAAWWISICVVGSAYICITASMFFWEWNPYVITVLCLFGYIPAKWAINRLTPNGEFQETTTVTRNNSRVGGGNGQRFLNP